MAYTVIACIGMAYVVMDSRWATCCCGGSGSAMGSVMVCFVSTVLEGSDSTAAASCLACVLDGVAACNLTSSSLILSS